MPDPVFDMTFPMDDATMKVIENGGTSARDAFFKWLRKSSSLVEMQSRELLREHWETRKVEDDMLVSLHSTRQEAKEYLLKNKPWSKTMKIVHVSKYKILHTVR